MHSATTSMATRATIREHCVVMLRSLRQVAT